MRIGVVSDTHNHLPNVGRIVALFNAAGVERVIHTGDITQPKVLDALAGLQMPLHGVLGNNDVGERDGLLEAAQRHGFELVDPPLQLHWHGRSILVVHDPLEFAPHLTASHDLALHGHTHRRRVERQGAQLIFNPGESAGHLAGHNAVGVVDLADLATEILQF